MKTESNETHRAIASCALDTPWPEIGEDALQRFLALSPEERGKAWAKCIRNTTKLETAVTTQVSAPLPLAPPATPLPRVVTMPAPTPPAPTPITSVKPSAGAAGEYPDSIIQVVRDGNVNYPRWMRKVPLRDLEKKGPIIFNAEGLVPVFHPDQKNGSVKALMVYEWLKATMGTDGAPLVNGCLGLAELEGIKKRDVTFFRTYFPGIDVFGWRSVISDKAEKTAEEFITRPGREGLPDFDAIKKMPFISKLIGAREQPQVEEDDAINLRVPYLSEITNEVKLVWLSLDKPVNTRQPVLLFK